MAYPEGTPPAKAQILTDHIKVCPKHPLRESEEIRKKLRKALAELVGASEKTELEAMEVTIRSTPGPEKDKTAVINAIHVLIETERKDGAATQKNI